MQGRISACFTALTTQSMTPGVSQGQKKPGGLRGHSRFREMFQADGAAEFMGCWSSC